MRMMGLRDSIYWLSWLLTAGVKNAIAVIAIAVVTFAGKIFEHTDVSLLIVFFLIFNW